MWLLWLQLRSTVLKNHEVEAKVTDKFSYCGRDLVTMIFLVLDSVENYVNCVFCRCNSSQDCLL